MNNTTAIDFDVLKSTRSTRVDYTAAIFMDLSKAFDVLDHQILATKLAHYGFRGKFLELLLNFISNRNYFVSTNGSKSITKTVNIGVP